jgi:hypothetical protein
MDEGPSGFLNIARPTLMNTGAGLGLEGEGGAAEVGGWG